MRLRVDFHNYASVFVFLILFICWCLFVQGLFSALIWISLDLKLNLVGLNCGSLGVEGCFGVTIWL